jgi:hypothetical protein
MLAGSVSGMSLTDLILAAEEVAEHEPLIHPYLVGAGALGILLLALIGLLAFGKGREHS